MNVKLLKSRLACTHTCTENMKGVYEENRGTGCSWELSFGRWYTE